MWSPDRLKRFLQAVPLTLQSAQKTPANDELRQAVEARDEYRLLGMLANAVSGDRVFLRECCAAVGGLYAEAPDLVAMREWSSPLGTARERLLTTELAQAGELVERLLRYAEDLHFLNKTPERLEMEFTTPLFSGSSTRRARTRLLNQSFAGRAVVAAMKACGTDAALQEEGCKTLWNIAGSLLRVEKLLYDGAAVSIATAMYRHSHNEAMQYYGAGAILAMAAKGCYAEKLRRKGGFPGHDYAKVDAVCDVLRHLLATGCFDAILSAMDGHPKSVRIQSFGCQMMIFFGSQEVVDRLQARHAADAVRRLLQDYGDHQELRHLAMAAFQTIAGNGALPALETLLSSMAAHRSDPETQVRGCDAIGSQAGRGGPLPPTAGAAVLQVMGIHERDVGVLCSGLKALWSLSQRSEGIRDHLVGQGAAERALQSLRSVVRSLGISASRPLALFGRHLEVSFKEALAIFQPFIGATEAQNLLCKGHGGHAALLRRMLAMVSTLCRGAVQSQLMELGAGELVVHAMRTYGCDVGLQRLTLRIIVDVAAHSEKLAHQLWYMGAGALVAVAMKAYANDTKIQEAGRLALAKLLGSSPSKAERLKAVRESEKVAEAVRQIRRPSLEKIQRIPQWPLVLQELGGRPLEQIRGWLRLDFEVEAGADPSTDPSCILVREVIGHCRNISKLSLLGDGGLGLHADEFCAMLAQGCFPKLRDVAPEHCIELGEASCLGLPEDSFFISGENAAVIEMVRMKIMYGTELLPDWSFTTAARVCKALASERHDRHSRTSNLIRARADAGEWDDRWRAEAPFGTSPNDFCADRDKVLAAVSKRAVALRFAAHHLRRDREVILAAVESTANRVEFWDSEAAMWTYFEKHCVDPALASWMRRWCEWRHGKGAADEMAFDEVHAQYVSYPEADRKPDREYEQYPNLGWVFQATLAETEDGEEPEEEDDLEGKKRRRPQTDAIVAEAEDEKKSEEGDDHKGKKRKRPKDTRNDRPC